VRALLVAGALMATPSYGPSIGQPLPGLPFAPGERLTFEARLGRFGSVGTAVMSIDGPVEVRGQRVYHLRFDIDTRVGPVRVRNLSESWLDAGAMAVLRFHRYEKHPLSKRDETYEIFPAEQRWQREDGEAGRTMSEVPLDELSFLYFLRTVQPEGGAASRFDRHFESTRNPTLVRVLGQEQVTTPAGTFVANVIEMQVRDDRYKGGGTIRMHLSDDARRLPLRIESKLPIAGQSVLLLTSYTPGR